MTDHQQTVHKAMRFIVTLLLLAGTEGLSSSVKSNSQELESMIEMYDGGIEDNPVALVDSVWESQDLGLINDCIWSGHNDLVTAVKIHFGNAADSSFRSAVAVHLLKAPARFWGGSHAIPSTGTGTVDFAMRRAILDVISRNLGPEIATLEDLKDRDIRKDLARKLEASLNGNTYRGPENGRQVNPKIPESTQRGNIGQRTQGEGPSSQSQESLGSRLLITVVVGLTAAITLVMILLRVRRAKSQGITRRRS